eukprot:CAMPEP_0114368330 /NCGR_PEP_ID=MMETSP0101-20121206/30747_1 /TAXON_ID=38822 ORGANISM="Pteridomonas danica, Strain PT" /NCGR_SAMPLE_ID=MMETSP0101 /ASSEMBLY_ACC=CAM_ASM_000211 /LENGTH=546 /DNA_ID=CAMNT_0001518441 /DNA_START=1219 /DNA_END=2860 /DNA_ORIENTATION=-
MSSLVKTQVWKCGDQFDPNELLCLLVLPDLADKFPLANIMTATRHYSRICEGCKSVFHEDEVYKSPCAIDILFFMDQLKDKSHASLSELIVLSQDMKEVIDEFKCEGICQSRTTARRCVDNFYVLPEVLIFHVNRWIHTKEVDFTVQYNEELCIKETKSGQNIHYLLKSVIVYRSANGKSGHYLCYALHTNDAGVSSWYECNESNITKCHIEAVLKQKALLLLYEKKVATRNLEHTVLSYNGTEVHDQHPLNPILATQSSVEMSKGFIKKQLYQKITEAEDASLSLQLAKDDGEVVASLPCGAGDAEVDILGQDLRRLQPGIYLNDEIVNAYMYLVHERNKKLLLKNSDETIHKQVVYFYSSYFMNKLALDPDLVNILLALDPDHGFQNVKRWSFRAKGGSIFNVDVLIIPINVDKHWVLLVVNFVLMTIQCYDSLGFPGRRFIKVIKQYLKDQILYEQSEEGRIFAAKQVHYSQPSKYPNIDSLSELLIPECPRQSNGFDCGVFVCMYASYLTLGEAFDFSQQDMPTIRKRMAVDIISKKIVFHD